MRILCVVLAIFLIAILEAVALDHVGNSPVARWAAYACGCLLLMGILLPVKRREARRLCGEGGQGKHMRPD